MARTPYTAEIVEYATTHGLRPELIEALVMTESSGVAWAWNPEPKYRWMWDVRANRPFRGLLAEEIAAKRPPSDFPCLAGDPDQEWWAQQASWGLMQIMGAVARELGFKGPYLTALCEPAVNLNLGCLKLAQLMVWSDGHETRALAAYNGGKFGNEVPPYRNQAYASKVFNMIRPMEPVSYAP